MSKIMDMKRKVQRKAEKVILDEVVKRLEKAVELKDQGKDAEGDMVMKEMKEWLKRICPDEEKELSEFVIDRSILPKEGEVVAIGDKVWLGVIKKDEKEKYLSVSEEYSTMKNYYQNEQLREKTWQDFLADSTFVCSIYEKETNEYVGYCSIREFVKGDWELAIELMPEACHKGYGTEALPLLMHTIYKLTGRRFYRARVEIDNHPSQGLMKKLGAIPNGVSEFIIHGDEIKKFQEDNKDLITDEIRTVAAEFCMEAEDILGYVLEYRFDVEKV